MREIRAMKRLCAYTLFGRTWENNLNPDRKISRRVC
jgi:hypothetical protein